MGASLEFAKSVSSSAQADDPVRRGLSIESRQQCLLDAPPEPVIGLAEGETRWWGMTAGLVS
jgi:hypothetical protein